MCGKDPCLIHCRLLSIAGGRISLWLCCCGEDEVHGELFVTRTSRATFQQDLSFPQFPNFCSRSCEKQPKFTEEFLKQPS